MKTVDTYYKIKTSKLLVLIFILGIVLFSGKITYSQVKGPDRIVGEYTGDLKKDLANGPGKANGFDSYEGNFKKGFPDGAGVYSFGSNVILDEFKYKTGDTYSGNFIKGKFHGKGNITFADTAKPDLVGYWEEGRYVGRTEKGYEVIFTDGITRVICHYNSSALYQIKIIGLADVRPEKSKSVEFTEGLTKYLPADGNLNNHSYYYYYKSPPGNLIEGLPGGSADLPFAMYRDLKESSFPMLIHISGSAPHDMSKSVLVLMLEKPGEWEIIIDTD